MTGSSPTAGVLRRVAAASYDVLLLAALWMLTTLALIGLRGGEALPPGKLGYQLLLLVVAALFFITSWTRGGQTLGMRAWRLKVELESGAPLGLGSAVIRFFGSILSVLSGGLGLLWLWIDRDELTWHDRLAGTRVIVVPKRAE